MHILLLFWNLAAAVSSWMPLRPWLLRQTWWRLRLGLGAAAGCRLAALCKRPSPPPIHPSFPGDRQGCGQGCAAPQHRRAAQGAPGGCAAQRARGGGAGAARPGVSRLRAHPLSSSACPRLHSLHVVNCADLSTEAADRRPSGTGRRARCSWQSRGMQLRNSAIGRSCQSGTRDEVAEVVGVKMTAAKPSPP